MIPTIGVTAGLLATDEDNSRQISVRRTLIKKSQFFSNAGVAALAGTTGGMYLLGRATGNDHHQETSLLATEAALDGVVLSEVFKVSTQRARPDRDGGRGKFWSGGSSFPSEHSTIAWSIASVMAHEYPGPLTRLLAYGSAAGISAARVVGRDHFPSDAFVGSTLGYLIGTHVYKRRHDPELWGAAYGEFESDSAERRIGSSATSYVAVDSPAYELVTRLAADGYISSAILGQRPWTQAEFRRLTKEAEANLSPGASSLDREILAHLLRQFEQSAQSDENQISLESLYTRVLDISGDPLNDSYHFGQTIINDYGRPYGNGVNGVVGGSFVGNVDPFVLYVRGEYQHAGSTAAYSETVRQVIANADFNPLQPATASTGIDDGRLLEAYVGFDLLGKYQVTVGKQDLWWGPAQGGAMSFSTNAEPIYMARLTDISPAPLPWFLRRLGPVKTDFFFGQVAGHNFPAHPFLHGQKVSLKPTENLELGFSRTVVFAGDGHPFTTDSFLRSFFSVSNNAFALTGGRSDVGDRRGGVDITYRVPRLRRWLSVYADAMTDDDISPVAAPHRAAYTPGLYLAHFPGLPRLDVRIEAPFSRIPQSDRFGGRFFYWNVGYHDAYTNKGDLLGSWVGRNGQGYQAWTSYTFAPGKKVVFSARNFHISPTFIPEGGRLTDGRVEIDWPISRNVAINASTQVERWLVPVLDLREKTNVSTAVELRFRPNWSSHF